MSAGPAGPAIEPARGDGPSARPPLPTGVWRLGFVSLLMDVSSEMVHSLLPLFLVGTLGASLTVVGLIEGLAEATALVVKMFSGALSDRLGRRKGLAVAGYALGALTKPMFALAGGLGMVTTARCVDRVGKGIRGAPRDALLADLTPAGVRGAAFGLRQALDTVGAVLGPLLAAVLLWAWAGDYRAVFWAALLPGLMAVALLVWGVREPPRPCGSAACAASGMPGPRAAWHAGLGAGFWWIVAVGAVFTLARFSEAFLVLRAQGSGVALALVPMVMVAMSLAYAATAYPFGRLGDRVGRRGLLAAGMGVLIVADLMLAWAATPGRWWWLAGMSHWFRGPCWGGKPDVSPLWG